MAVPLRSVQATVKPLRPSPHQRKGPASPRVSQDGSGPQARATDYMETPVLHEIIIGAVTPRSGVDKNRDRDVVKPSLLD